MKNSKQLITILLSIFLLNACGSAESESSNETLEDLDNWEEYEMESFKKDGGVPFGFSPEQCAHYREPIRRFNLKTSIKGTYKEYFVRVDGTRIVLSKKSDYFSHKEFQISGDSLCIQAEFTDLSKGSLAFAVELNDTLISIKRTIANNEPYYEYDTLIPLNAWGINKTMTNELAHN